MEQERRGRKMKEMQKHISQHLVEHMDDIIEKWLDSIYSMKTPYTSPVYEPLYKAELKADSKQTVGLVTDFFADDQEKVETSLNNWLEHMYQRRIKNDVPLPEVIMTLDKLRQQVLNAIADLAIQHAEITKEDFAETIRLANRAFDKIIGDFTTMYFTQIVEYIESQRSFIDEISAPIIEIIDGIAILPVIGRVDRERAQHLMESAIKRCNDLSVDSLCLDLSASTTFDTALAEMLFHLSSITKLSGIELVLSGIKPKMAQEMIRVNMDVDIPAYHSLKEFLKSQL